MFFFTRHVGKELQKPRDKKSSLSRGGSLENIVSIAEISVGFWVANQECVRPTVTTWNEAFICWDIVPKLGLTCDGSNPHK